MKTSKLFLTSLLAVFGGASFASPLGAASSFNVFVRKNFTSQYSDTQGNMAIGGNMTVSGYSTGLLSGGAGKKVLEVAGDLNYTSGSIEGTSLYGGNLNLKWVGLNYGAPAKGSTIDFDAAFKDLRAKSSQWALLPTTGTALQTYSTLNFTGSNSGLNVFTITADQLNRGDLYQVKFNLPVGGKAIVNVLGSTGNFRNIGYDNFAPEDVLWNFPTATSITNNAFKGSLLAPNADISGGYGVIEGQVIANSFTGPTQINLHLYSGNIQTQAVPEPASMVALGAGVLAVLRRRKSA
ncbi:MAG: choice-of-anchor A family protein [Fimbriimonas sp.]